MRDFLLKCFKNLHDYTGLRQYVEIANHPDEEYAQNKLDKIIDGMVRISNSFNPFIDHEAQKKVIEDRIIDDPDFFALNARVVWKWLNQECQRLEAVKKLHFKESGHEETNKLLADMKPQTISPEVQKEIDDYMKSLQTDLKHVPEVTQEEIDAIKLEDLEAREGRKSIAPVRPEWIVGETCPSCEGHGSVMSPENGLGMNCPECVGMGEINLVKVHAETEQEARKAYNATFKK